MTDVNPQQTVVLLGNDAPVMQTADGAAAAEHLNQSVTRVEMWPGFDDQAFVDHTLSTDNDRVLTMIARSLPDNLKKYAVGINELEQIWAAHSQSGKPAYVSSNDAEYAQAISNHFGCPVGEPVALLTSVGRDAVHGQHLGTSAQPAAFNYIAVTASAVAPASGDTVLTSEITTAGGGLLRAQATYAHTVGTNTSTLTKTFTANGSDSLPVTIAGIGVFNNAVSGGTIAYHTNLTSTATLTASGDNMALTETVTAG